MATVAASSRERLDIGTVFTDAFGLLRRQGLLFGAVLLVSSIPGLVNQFIQLQTTHAAMNAMLAGATPHPLAASLGGALVGFVMTIASFVLLPTVYAGVTYASVRDLDGARVDILDSLKIGLRSWFGFVGLVLLMIVPLFFGFILLIIPGVMLAVAWSVAVQTKIAERIGPSKP